MAIKFKGDGSSSSASEVTGINFNSDDVYKVLADNFVGNNRSIWNKPVSLVINNNMTSTPVTANITASEDPSVDTSSLSSVIIPAHGFVTMENTRYLDTIKFNALSMGNTITVRRKVGSIWTTLTSSTSLLNYDYTNSIEDATIQIRCCFLPEAQVLISLDGTTKAIKDLTSGDTVVTYNKLTNQFIETEFFMNYTREVSTMGKIIFSDNSELILTTDHIIYDSNKNEKTIDGTYGTQLNVGDEIICFGGNKTVSVIDYISYNEPITTYDASLVSGTTLIVEGVVCISALDNSAGDTTADELNENNTAIFRTRMLSLSSGSIDSGNSSTLAAGGGTVSPNACTNPFNSSISSCCAISSSISCCSAFSQGSCCTSSSLTVICDALCSSAKDTAAGC